MSDSAFFLGPSREALGTSGGHADPSHLDRKSSSNPTHTRTSPPDVLCQDNGTPKTAEDEEREQSSPARRTALQKRVVCHQRVPRCGCVSDQILREASDRARDSRPAIRRRCYSKKGANCVDKHLSTRNYLAPQQTPVVWMNGHLSVSFGNVAVKAKVSSFSLAFSRMERFKSAAIGARSWSEKSGPGIDTESVCTIEEHASRNFATW